MARLRLDSTSVTSFNIPTQPQHPLFSLDEDTDKPFFPPHTFLQPLDHFSSQSPQWAQRYWLNARYYTPGGPVFLFDTGEGPGEDRFGVLDTGIVAILARETGGMAVVLEHRYYGQSMPVSNLSTDSLRFLNNAQAAADSANFMRSVHFPGVDEDVSALNRPWIYYGGSYGGARAAHMRVLYPELVWGAIASSAVTNAEINNYEYFEIIADYASPHCISALRASISLIDTHLSSPFLAPFMKSLFSLSPLSNSDFAAILSAPLGAWQGKNWDEREAHRPGEWEEFCKCLTRGVGNGMGKVAAWMATRNYAQYIKDTVVSECPEGMTVADCFGSDDPTKFQNTSITESWRSWAFQVCTEWGYFFAAPPYPSIVSQHLQIDANAKHCQAAFPNGEHYIIPAWPNVSIVNELGSYGIAAERLALIDGEWDPWRPRTPHSIHAPVRNDTISEPFMQIPAGVHHYDENGLADPRKEPLYIQKVHHEEIGFVKAWLAQWRVLHGRLVTEVM
ncbi:peptidase S28 [Dacryopinax primogenitus]|uniref:Peptidase S28 n=1 Tax=Dacryopinax primogenitus (strain DJM 731) TaxID=1858805 RepID=M5G9H9_DACPD|nr:peptidase S28 [Dacryopinax primogenitus]EJU00458.1 peptidase S28 [Dacryopinax primogenitus]